MNGKMNKDSVLKLFSGEWHLKISVSLKVEKQPLVGGCINFPSKVFCIRNGTCSDKHENIKYHMKVVFTDVNLFYVKVYFH